MYFCQNIHSGETPPERTTDGTTNQADDSGPETGLIITSAVSGGIALVAIVFSVVLWRIAVKKQHGSRESLGSWPDDFQLKFGKDVDRVLGTLQQNPPPQASPTTGVVDG